MHSMDCTDSENAQMTVNLNCVLQGCIGLIPTWAAPPMLCKCSVTVPPDKRVSYPTPPLHRYTHIGHTVTVLSCDIVYRKCHCHGEDGYIQIFIFHQYNSIKQVTDHTCTCTTVCYTCIYSLAPSGPFDVARTIFKPYHCTISHMHTRRPRARSRMVYTGQVLPVSMRWLGARL